MQAAPKVTLAELQLEPVLSVAPDTTLRVAAQIFSTTGASTLLVDTTPRSEITGHDFIRAFAKGVPADTPVQDIVSGDPLFVHRHAAIDRVLEVMLHEQRHSVVVLDDNEDVVGLLTLLVAVAACTDGPPWLGALRVALRIDGNVP